MVKNCEKKREKTGENGKKKGEIPAAPNACTNHMIKDGILGEKHQDFRKTGKKNRGKLVKNGEKMAKNGKKWVKTKGKWGKNGEIPSAPVPAPRM